MHIPVNSLFFRYFGGSLDLVSLDGWGKILTYFGRQCVDCVIGTDAYVRLPKLVSIFSVNTTDPCLTNDAITGYKLGRN